MKILITAGGQGTKLWPYSRGNKPKQFQPIIGDKSSYSETVEALLTSFAAEDIYVSTKRRFIRYISEQTPQIPLKNYIIEPDLAKDRGPGEGLAFLRLSVAHPGEPFFLVQADCARQPEAAFLKMISDAEKIVSNNKKYLTGGQKATEPHLGVDYLLLGERVAGCRDQEVYEVAEFLGRRSSLRETKNLIENFHIVTHCNHACWYPELMLEAYKQYRPDWHTALMKMRDCFDKPGEDAAIEALYAGMEKGATEEVTKHVMKDGQIILLPFKWTDIGTWSSIYEFFVDGDGAENYKDGKVVTVDSKGCLIKGNDGQKLIAVAGLEDIVIIDTEDALLVIPKERMDKLKDLQHILAEGEDKKYL